MRRFLISTILVAVLVVLSGCSQFNSDTMVCTLQEQTNNTLEYDVKYSGNSISGLTIVKTIDFSTFDDATFAQQEKTIKQSAKKVDALKGVSESIQVDQKAITDTVDIDISKYDIINDTHYLLTVYFSDSDLDSITNMRNKLQNSGFKCDEVTEK